MEYCSGGSVIDLINITETNLTEEQIASICYPTLLAIDFLHSTKKIHRDIKAGNILLDHLGHAKLGDFGVSARLAQTLAKANTFIGTPCWMSPEVLMKSEYN